MVEAFLPTQVTGEGRLSKHICIMPGLCVSDDTYMRLTILTISILEG